MSCEARTERDGSWHCRRCGTFGDIDEKPECLSSSEIAHNNIGTIKRKLVNGQATKKPVN